MAFNNERYGHVEAGHAASEYDDAPAYPRFGVRRLLRHPLTTAIVVLMFALGFAGLLATFWPAN
jgi:hypothetical protein